MTTTGQRVALITGAGAGLGWATAQRLADDGMRVICLGRGENVVARAAELRSRGKDADSEIVDVADAQAVKAGIKNILARHGRVDVLVNNAGFGLIVNGRSLDIHETNDKDWGLMMAIHLTAPFILLARTAPNDAQQRLGPDHQYQFPRRPYRVGRGRSWVQRCEGRFDRPYPLPRRESCRRRCYGECDRTRPFPHERDSRDGRSERQPRPCCDPGSARRAGGRTRSNGVVPGFRGRRLYNRRDLDVNGGAFIG